MTDAAPAIDLHGVSRRFGATRALHEADLVVRRGTLHMLLGENGAGKTTLARIAAGLLMPDSGSVRVAGTAVRGRIHGVGFVHQHFSLVPTMTVAENVALTGPQLWRRFDPRRSHRQVDAISRSARLPIDPGAFVARLTVGEQQRVEILRALTGSPHTLILDEPTASLAPGESAELYRWLRAFVAEGRTALVITHRVREVLAHADAVTVLRRGRVVLDRERADVTEPELVTAIVGDSARASEVRAVASRTSPVGVTRVSMQHVSCRGDSSATLLRDVSLSIAAGEVVGVAGVDGSGCRELLRLLSGHLKPTDGVVRREPGAVAFIPEDRLREGLIADMSLLDNFALRRASAPGVVLRWDIERRDADVAMSKFDVRGGSVDLPAFTLSGGNQQRFVLARELSTAPTLIVAENPTRGLDVRAARDVIAVFARASSEGAAVVVYSSDLDELVAMAERVLVCHAGAVREVAPSVEAIGAALTGAAAA